MIQYGADTIEKMLIRGNFTKRVSNHLGLLNEETKISRIALATKIDKKPQ